VLVRKNKQGMSAQERNPLHPCAYIFCWVISNQVFVLLIPRCCPFSPMPPISTSGVGLACNTEPIGGVTFRSIVKSTIEASEAASIEDTRHKELLDLQTELRLHQAWVFTGPN
jgi:hypothetical protein